jgi:hypothetical protein
VASGTGASTLIVSTSSATTLGTYTITVTGTSGSLSHSVTIPVTVSSSTVGGVIVPVDKLALLAPYLALASVAMASVVVLAIHARRAWRRKI